MQIIKNELLNEYVYHEKLHNNMDVFFMPKRGFTNINAKEYAIVNLDQLNAFEDGAEVTPVVLIEAGIVKAEKSGIKILGNGELTKKLTVKAAKFSKSAEEAITSKGGSVEVI